MRRKRTKIKQGDIFNRLTINSFFGKDKWFNSRWDCICICGKHTIVTTSALSGGKTKSCGCWRDELKTKHGECNKSKEYKAWLNIKNRCRNPNTPDYKFYGKLGIKMCDRWANSFICFLQDMGRAPSSKHSIDREIGTGNYEPGNCRWVTHDIQCRYRKNNRYFEYYGEKMILADWAKRLGITYNNLYQKLDRGHSFHSIMKKHESENMHQV